MSLVASEMTPADIAAVSGNNEVWLVIDELMETVHAIQPKLYDAVLRKLKEM